MGNKTKVRILSRGENGEGSTVRGVFRTLKLAKAAAEEEVPDAENYLTWIPVDSSTLRAWINSVDYLLIETVEVQS